MTAQQNTQNNRNDWGWLIAIILPLIGILPTFNIGIMKAADAPLHVQRIFAMGTLISGGELYPRWVPWFHLGYGYPIFNFYPPGVFYLGGLLMQIGISAVMAYHIIAATAWISGTLGTYKLARTFLPGYAAIFAAALWAYAPSRLFEVWTQGSLPQIAAASFIPWLLYTVVRGAFHPSRRSAIWIGLSLAGLIFSHQPITFITALFVAPTTLILILWASRKNWHTFLNRAVCVYGGLLLGVGVSMIFLLPMLLELRIIDAVGGTDDVIAYLRSNFLSLQEIFAYPHPVDLTDLRAEYPMTLGLVGCIFAFLGGIALITKRQYAIFILILTGLSFTIFMMLEISLPIWETIPFFAQLRFPARFLRIGAIFIALVGGASLLLIPQRFRLAGTVTAITVAIITTLPLTYPSQPWVTYPNISALTEIEFEQSTYAWGTTSYNEFKPRWGDNVPLDDPASPAEYITNPKRIVPFDKNLPYEQVTSDTIRIKLDNPQPLALRQFYYPGWLVTVNGEPAEIYPNIEHGVITVNLPSGEHLITIVYRGTLIQRIGTIMTLVSIIMALGIFQTGKKQIDIETTQSAKAIPVLVGSTAIIAFVIINHFYISPQTNWFRVQSSPENPRYMQTAQYNEFGESIALLGYTLNENEISQNDVLPITLYWQPLNIFEEEDFRPVVQIVNLPVTETWAVSQPFFPGSEHTFSGRYTPSRFTSDTHDLRLFGFAKPYAAHIMAQMFDVKTNQPLLLPDGSDRVLLDTLIQVNLPEQEIIQRLDYTFENTIELWCKSITSGEGSFTVTFYWHVKNVIGEDVRTFVHGLDEANEIISQADQPPIPAYPTSLWRKGQTLQSQYTLPANDMIQTIAIGLYREDGTRLQITQNDKVLPNNQILLPLLESDCVRES